MFLCHPECSFQPKIFHPKFFWVKQGATQCYQASSFLIPVALPLCWRESFLLSARNSHRKCRRPKHRHMGAHEVRRFLHLPLNILLCPPNWAWKLQPPLYSRNFCFWGQCQILWFFQWEKNWNLTSHEISCHPFRKIEQRWNRHWDDILKKKDILSQLATVCDVLQAEQNIKCLVIQARGTKLWRSNEMSKVVDSTTFIRKVHFCDTTTTTWQNRIHGVQRAHLKALYLLKWIGSQSNRTKCSFLHAVRPEREREIDVDVCKDERNSSGICQGNKELVRRSRELDFALNGVRKRIRVMTDKRVDHDILHSLKPVVHFYRCLSTFLLNSFTCTCCCHLPWCC